MAKVIIQILRGGSGKWVGREVISFYPNGRVSQYGEGNFAGHVPKRVNADLTTIGQVIARQVRRQILGEPPKTVRLGGGHQFYIALDGDSHDLLASGYSDEVAQYLSK